MFNLQNILRKNVKELKPYSSARDEYKGKDAIFLDANESPVNTLYNRYPDPMQWEVKQKISALKGVKPEQIFLGNGSDEAIDLLIRIVCDPRKDNIISIDPSYGMYQVSANTNDVEFRKVLLMPDNFQLDVKALLAAADENSKLMFICSPNNPTGNCIDRDDVIYVLERFNGLVVVDEAYIDFTEKYSFVADLQTYPNLVIMQTFSKAWGLAGARLGVAYASEEIVGVINKIKPPYNINTVTQKVAIQELSNYKMHLNHIETIIEQKNSLEEKLAQLKVVEKVFPSDANFILIRVPDANALYDFLVSKGIVIRNRTSQSLLKNCLRITVGTAEENEQLIEAMRCFM